MNRHSYKPGMHGCSFEEGGIKCGKKPKHLIHKNPKTELSIKEAMDIINYGYIRNGQAADAEPLVQAVNRKISEVEASYKKEISELNEQLEATKQELVRLQHTKGIA